MNPDEAPLDRIAKALENIAEYLHRIAYAPVEMDEDLDL
jgi:hypothetical protein